MKNPLQWLGLADSISTWRAQWLCWPRQKRTFRERNAGYNCCLNGDRTTSRVVERSASIKERIAKCETIKLRTKKVYKLPKTLPHENWPWVTIKVCSLCVFYSDRRPQWPFPWYPRQFGQGFNVVSMFESMLIMLCNCLRVNFRVVHIQSRYHC